MTALHGWGRAQSLARPDQVRRATMVLDAPAPSPTRHEAEHDVTDEQFEKAIGEAKREKNPWCGGSALGGRTRTMQGRSSVAGRRGG